MTKKDFSALLEGDFSILTAESVNFLYASSSPSTKQSTVRKGSFYFSAEIPFYPEGDDSEDLTYKLIFRYSGRQENFFVRTAFVIDTPEMVASGNALTLYLTEKGTNLIEDERALNPLIIKQIKTFIVNFINNHKPLWSLSNGYAFKRYSHGDMNMSIEDIF